MPYLEVSKTFFMSFPVKCAAGHSSSRTNSLCSCPGPGWGRHTGEVATGRAAGPPKRPEPQGSPAGLLRPKHGVTALCHPARDNITTNNILSVLLTSIIHTHCILNILIILNILNMRTVQYKFMFTVWHDKMSLLNSHWTTKVETVKVH